MSYKNISYEEYTQLLDEAKKELQKEKEEHMNEKTIDKVKRLGGSALNTIIDKGPGVLKKVGTYVYENRETIIGLVITGVVLDNAISMNRWRRARTRKLKAETRQLNRR